MKKECDGVMEEVNDSAKISRNARCPCGSGKKYKMCCGAKVVEAERMKTAQASRFWMPDGVTVEKDEQPDDWISDRPRWRRTFTVCEDTDIDEGIETLCGNFVRAYFTKYCSRYDFCKEECLNGVMLLEFYTKSNRPLASCPTVIAGSSDTMWGMLRSRLASFLSSCICGEFSCVVRWDSRYGGPILSLKSSQEEVIWVFARPNVLDDDEPEDAEEIEHYEEEKTFHDV